ncbi:nickel-dependent lactate racemase [Anaerobacterium chartisolvens]|uniref:Nickel-dependent lactate racemase n=1 Tax=Anaerobacterium chartisolvens TaxID=1297424 RepID=A0A369B6E2_9FIRM|nr:nickel-dependent lactate racemase [Anaerobacterium chartisolvens]RCX16895.1 nickel-dependent lactate racemase [Anaerobacterium chartisolvens]
MNFELGFGKAKAHFSVKEENVIGVLQPNAVSVGSTGEEEVKRALHSPIASERLKYIVNRGEKIVIITSDITRPMPSRLVIPGIIEELKEAGVRLEDITVVFALGSHRKHTEEEKKYLVGEQVYSSVKCIDSDMDDFVHMGTTSSGTPVDIFRAVAEADRRICIGNIEYHYFAGYSGGAKAIMPGVSTRAAIQANHSKMVMEEAKAGEMVKNPVRRDIDEVVDFVPIDFILNVVLDENKNIIKAVAGHYIKAHREGCDFLDKLYKVKISERADIVVVSAGGYPKDINLYQAQKALDNAKHAVRDGGVIILVASCKEGYGEEVFEHWIKRSSAPSELTNEIQRNFELGGHKAAAIAMVLNKCSIYMVSDLDVQSVRKIYMKPYSELQQAFNDAVGELGENSSVIVMPYGGSTLPDAEK